MTYAITEGFRDQIRGALREQGPLSRYKLHLATGIGPEQLRRIVNDMVTRGNLVIVERAKRGGYKFSVFGLPSQALKKPAPAPKNNGPFAIAGPITIPQYRYGSSRLG